ncbi:16S rRNA (cytosine(1402)-N(4))-methyltransferase RsmH [Hahella sp. SMD15-11]|uniref:Ribosomal RNA small subunit methyltransferase H n=1 Tax=Thermohahella caldifontis TaxID=3142973 RepID=A0AB39UWL7_9GAMM
MMHASVLLNESIDLLQPERGGIFLDGTFGRGGHSRAILSRLPADGRLLATDKDPEAIEAGRLLAEEDGRFSIFHASFADVDAVLASAGAGALDGVLLDLGVSSPQLDQAERGFSFLKDGLLDMRMDCTRGESAADWIARAEEDEMVRVFRDYGEERYAKRIARAIVSAREEAPITRTTQLAEIVAAAHPRWEKHKHPATRIFQAIRIHVNDELGDLERALVAMFDRLAPGGRLVVISFHSLEDRIVKRFMKTCAQPPHIPRDVPVRDSDLPAARGRLLARKVRPGERELAGNPRARSAVLRALEKR